MPSDPYILVVEDDPDVRDLMKLLLEVEGYHVACAENGLDALAQMRRAASPHLILLDLMMPIMDGWQFRREQKQDPVLADIPVVIISAASDPASVAANAFLQKPVAVHQLLETVRRHW